MRTPTGRGTRARRCSQSTPGRIAAETMKPRKSRAITTLIFQSASARTTIEPATSVTIAARLAVELMSRVPALSVEACNPDACAPDGTNLRRHAAPRHRAREAALAGARARGARRDGLCPRVAAFAGRGGPPRRRRLRRIGGGLAVGPHPRRPDDGEALHRPRRRPAPGGGRASRARRRRRGRPVAPRPPLRLRDDRRGGARDPGRRAAARADRARAISLAVALHEHLFARYNGRSRWLPTSSLSTAPASTT